MCVCLLLIIQLVTSVSCQMQLFSDLVHVIGFVKSVMVVEEQP